MTKFVRQTVLVLAMGYFLLWACWQSLGDGMLHIHYLNIGQGDAAIIRTPSLQHILVDGGPDQTVVQELAAVMPFYKKTIDIMILTHPHADHMDGLTEVLARYEVKRIILTGVAYDSPGYEEFFRRAKNVNADLIFIDGQHDYSLGDVIMDIVYPLTSVQGEHFENLNNSSVSFRLLYGEHAFYFSGDLEEEGEEKLLASGQNIKSQVLKTGHHGSRTSTTEPFLEMVQPNIAIISCGVNNSFKHPHPETIQKLQSANVTIYRTDLDGRVEVKSDGENLYSHPA